MGFNRNTTYAEVFQVLHGIQRYFDGRLLRRVAPSVEFVVSVAGADAVSRCVLWDLPPTIEARHIERYFHEVQP